MTPDTWLDTADKLSRIFSIGAIPLVLGVGGWLIQRKLQDRSIRRDYVKLALTLLQNTDKEKVPPAIREWAVDLLNENSPTKLNAQAIQSLKSGDVTLPAFSFSGLTPELTQAVASYLEDFKKYLVNLGFTVPTETISVKVLPGTAVESGGSRGVAFWEADNHSILAASAFASDRAMLLRQFTHAMLDPAETSPWDYFAIESGAASYFSCSFLNHPVVGDKASAAGKAILPPRDLRKQRPFSAIDLKQWESIQNDGSEIWGGALWQVRQLLGQAKADRLIADTWHAFGSEVEEGEAYASFANALLANAKSIDDGGRAKQMQAIFENRGLDF